MAHKINIKQVRKSLALVHAQIDVFFELIPHDMVPSFLTYFQSLLIEYDLIVVNGDHWLGGVHVSFSCRRLTALRNFREIVVEAINQTDEMDILQPVITELDFLISAEMLLSDT